MLNNTVKILLLCWLLFPALAFAETGNDKIEIRADHLKINVKTGDSVYTGNVSFVQGYIQLSGEIITVKSRDNEIHHVEVEGKPARYRFEDSEKNKVNAYSGHMEYSVDQNRLVMTDNARLEQTDNIVESQRIVYDTENQVIVAGIDNQSGNAGQRVNITLTPKKK